MSRKQSGPDAKWCYPSHHPPPPPQESADCHPGEEWEGVTGSQCSWWGGSPFPHFLMALPALTKEIGLQRKTHTGRGACMQEEAGVYSPTGELPSLWYLQGHFGASNLAGDFRGWEIAGTASTARRDEGVTCLRKRWPSTTQSPEALGGCGGETRWLSWLHVKELRD